jgi:gluconokinase
MIIALDVGTSSARASLYDDAGAPVEGHFHQVAYEPATTADGGVEHDASVLLEAAAACIDRVCRGLPRGADVLGVGVSTFWHGLLGLDAAQRPVTPVFMWADSRSAPDAALLRDALDEDALHARTGCHLHASYWPAKLRWLARERPALVTAAVRWGSFGEHLEAALFGEAGTSVSMATGTGLFDVDTGRWDPGALAAAGVEPDRLFEVTDRTHGRRGLRAPWAGRWPALRSATWFPAVGDGAAGNVGSGCTDRHGIALNVGTSAALRIVRDDAPAPPRGLWRYGVDARWRMIGGATSEGGNVYAWCRDVLALPDDDALEAAIAAEPADAHGLTVLPFFAGERAPGWRGDKRAAFTGLSLDSTAVEITRAVLEAVALRLATVYDLLAPYAADDHVIVASGGAIARSRAWTQMIADACGRAVTWSRETEATSRGAALLALNALGALPDLGAVRAPLGETFAPNAARHARYRAALGRQQRLDERV